MPRLRLFANLREASGSGTAEVPAGTIEEVLAHAAERFGAGFSRALETAGVWVNGEPAGPGTQVGEGDEVALIPPVSGGTTLVQSPLGMEVALTVGLAVALFVSNAASLEWLSVVVVLAVGLWAHDLTGAAAQRGLQMGAVPVMLAAFAGVVATFRFGIPGAAAATVGAGLLALVWSVLTPRLRPVVSIAAAVVVSAMGAFGAGSMILLRLRSEAEMTSFLLVAAVSVGASWLVSAADARVLDPLTVAVVAALGAGVLAGAIWSEDLWPTVVAAAGAAIALVAGRRLGSLVRSGGFPTEDATPGSLYHLDGVVAAAGAFWLLLRLLA